MNCIDCNTDLSNGYQSASNLNLCNACAEYRQQGDDACIGCGSNVCEDALCKQNHADAVEERLYDEAEIEPLHPDYDDDGMTDMEADADALASAGWGTDEDYGYFGGEDY